MNDAERRARRRALYSRRLGAGDRRAALAFGVLGLTAAALAMVLVPYERPWAGAGLSLALAAAAGVDARRRILPDVLTLGLVLAGLIVFSRPGGTAFWDRAIGAGAGYVAFVGIELGYQRLRGRQGLGRGDAKLFAAIGAWLGWTQLPLVALLAALGGLSEIILRRAFAPHRESRTERLAFGPHLAWAAWALWMVGAG